MSNTLTPELYKCKMCGLESPLKEAFIHQKRLLLGTRTFCFECGVKRQWHSLLRTIILTLAAAGLLYLIIPGGFFGRVLLQTLAVTLLVLIPLIVAHELAHVVTGWLVGQRVFNVHIGAGKVLWSRRFLNARWYLHLLPVSGATVVTGPDMPGFRWRQFLVLLAGPALHAVLMLFSWLILLLLPYGWTGGPLYMLVLLLLWMNGLLLVSNLIPHKVAVSSGIAGSDGASMLKLLFKPDELLQKYHRAYYVNEVVDAVDRADLPAARRWSEQGARVYPQDAQVTNVVGYALIASGDYQPARDAFLRVLQFEGLEEVVRAMGLNNVAYANFMLADPDLRDQASDYSAEAYSKIPWEPAIMGTRGAVLLWLDRHDEGIELLKRAMLKTPDRRNQAADACFIALGEHLRGNPAESQKYLDLAKKLDPNSQALPRILPELV
jgi:hypothetical protein